MARTTANPAPRWRGFNLLDMFTTKSAGQWQEDDFRWIAEWGFDFVRLPLCYLLWVEGGAVSGEEDACRLDEGGLEKLDRGVELGLRHGLHVDLNFHRGPGYSVNREREEPFNLWKDAAALRAFCFHWRTLAERYAKIPPDELSFNLINEPTHPTEDMSREDHERVMRAGVEAIRAVDPDRPIVVDGLRWGNDPVPELADLGVIQSCRAYVPMGISHYKASWVGGEDWPEPSYPDPSRSDEGWDRAGLEAHYARWADLFDAGVGVHCGEGGAFSQTPQDVVLRWLRDVLDVLTSHGVGLALWNFRGAFGVLDSGREDVDYEDWHGHKLDRRMLELLREFA